MRRPDFTRRVAVTGLGIVSPVGTDVPTAWDNLINGRSGLKTITYWDPNVVECHASGEVHDFDANKWMDFKAVRRTDKNVVFGVAAAKQAVAEVLEAAAQTVRNRILSRPGRTCHIPPILTDPQLQATVVPTTGMTPDPGPMLRPSWILYRRVFARIESSARGGPHFFVRPRRRRDENQGFLLEAEALT